jgi:hypothetical protein
LSKKAVGRCRIFGIQSKLVKCHIIPKALTKAEEEGQKFWQAGEGARPVRKSTSWYDPHIVCRRGENLLEGIDDRAIKELRRNAMVWSGQQNGRAPQITKLVDEHSLREILGLDHKAIWMFFASIAWRASVSKISDLEFFKLESEIEDALRISILEDQPFFERFPCEFSQMTGRAASHNQTPTLDRKMIPNLNDGRDTDVEFARFFVDGLVCHFRLNSLPQGEFAGNHLFLGGSEKLICYARPFEGSAQEERLYAAIRELNDFQSGL